ncbi:MAG: hypothetical protein SFX73_28325 [Kofleriaceae bacterium]|nr:hypothetical protein [Kofleriaceae bacterium]
MRRTLALLVITTSSLAFAETAPNKAPSFTNPTAVALIEDQLLRPLAAKDSERSKFSRARVPATARRVRVLDRAALVDATGKAFVRFAVDERYGWFDANDDDSWNASEITGCAYLEAREVFIERGGKIHPAAARLGKKTKPVAGACEPSAQVVTR